MAKKAMSFEESIQRLETIVDQLENGNLPLEEALKLFEEGTALAGKCTKQLDEAEMKVTKLINMSDEKPVEALVENENELSE